MARICELVKSIVSEVCVNVFKDLSEDRNINVLVGAYNQYHDEEFGGDGYIFDIYNTEDLKFLLNNDMFSTLEIAHILNKKEQYFFYDGNTPLNVKIIPLDDVKEMLKNEAEEYMECAIKFVGRCGKESAYAKVYEEYITKVLDQ